MGVPTKYYTWVDGKTAAGLVTAARLNGNLDPLYACLNPAVGGLEDTNVKSGAKIVCTDRNYSDITGNWVFTICPTFPDASIPAGKLGPNVDADMVDGQHAAAFAAAAHNHNLNDLTEKSYNSLTDTPTLTGYALQFTALEMEPGQPEDDASYVIGGVASQPAGAGSGVRRVYIPKAGTVKVAYVYMRSGATTGSAENISFYVRKNNTTDTLIATVGAASSDRVFSNAALSIAVSVGDYIELKMVCPTWATNPQNVLLSGVVYVE